MNKQFLFSHFKDELDYIISVWENVLKNYRVTTREVEIALTGEFGPQSYRKSLYFKF